MNRSKMALVYGGLGALCAALGLWGLIARIGVAPDAWVIMIWPALSLGFVGAAYWLEPHWVVVALSKDPHTGKLPWWRALLMLPYLFIATLWWSIRQNLYLCLVERPYDMVAPGIYVGRYPIRYPSEFPDDCPNIVDVTCEFNARPDVKRGRKYICIPALDGDMPRPSAMLHHSQVVAKWKGDVYIHCANGHGRSASFAALVMIERNLCSDWEEAFAMMKSARPRINIHSTQKSVLDSVMQLKTQLAEVEAEKTAAVAGEASVTPVATTDDGTNPAVDDNESKRSDSPEPEPERIVHVQAEIELSAFVAAVAIVTEPEEAPVPKVADESV